MSIIENLFKAAFGIIALITAYMVMRTKWIEWQASQAKHTKLPADGTAAPRPAVATASEPESKFSMISRLYGVFMFLGCAFYLLWFSHFAASGQPPTQKDVYFTGFLLAGMFMGFVAAKDL